MARSRNIPVLLIAAGLPLILLAAGCGGPARVDKGPRTLPVPELWPDGDDLALVRPGCDILGGDVRPGGTFTVALSDSVVPGRAPVPHNRSERLVFANLYETLVQVDCDGSVRPGLADTWACTADSTTWVFTLRPDARFWDGTRVTSGDNAITGAKITVDRKNDRMTVESGNESRVNAVIFTGKDGLAQPPPVPDKKPGEK